MTRNVSEVVQEARCIGCGACSIICPTDAIEMRYDADFGLMVPHVGLDCVGCGKCLEVCFGEYSDIERCRNRTRQTFPSSEIGLHVFSGYAMNKLSRFRSSSGGVVTELLRLLMDDGLIDGAIVAGNMPHHPGLAESILARDFETMAKCATSKYCPVNYSKALREMVDGETYAVVALPCQLFALDHLTAKRTIGGRILLRIGLICGGTPSRHATEYLLDSLGLQQEAVEEISYRGGKWPGKMAVQSKSGIFLMSLIHYWPRISPWFTLARCLNCVSGFNVRADVSVGDLWPPSLTRADKLGLSLVIPRTKPGYDLLTDAKTNEYVRLQEIREEDALRSQRFMINRMDYCLSSIPHEKINRTVTARPQILLSWSTVITIGRFLASKRWLWPFLRPYAALIDALTRKKHSQ